MKLNSGQVQTESSAVRGVPEATQPPRVADHELLRRIGRGSYGEVWLARSATGAYRAVKIVYRRSFDDDRPFEREFSGIRNFEPISRKHDSQVDILHVGRGEDCFYYVMELADDQFSGQAIARDTYAPKTLKSELSLRGRLPFEECVQISLALTTALEHLHSHGLVHRDVKPSNIIFVNGVPKLADIGLVTGVDATRSFVGTEGFAAPEGPGTPQADIYSLGKVLYELCTGKDRGDFPELPTTLAEMPDCEGVVELNAVIGKACREDPRARYQSARAMHDELLLLQSGKSLGRMRAMERAVAKLRRVSAGIAVLTVVATVAFVYQSRQTRVIRKLLTDNIQLAQASKRAAAESLNRLVQSQMAEATRFLGEGDPGSALPSLVEALRNVQGDKSREPMHRVRLESVFDNHPNLFRLFVDEKGPLRCGFTTDGRKLFSQLKNGELKVYDLMSGGLLFTCSGTNKPSAPNGSRYSPSAFFSADGTRIILRGLMPGVSTEIFDMTDGHSICLPSAEAESSRVLDSIDGRIVLIAEGESTARVVHVDSGQPLSSLIHASGPIQCGRLSQDSRCLALLIATPSEPNPSPRARPKGLLQVWSVDSGQAIGSPIPVERDCRFLLSRTGERLAVAPLPGDDPQNERPTILNIRTGQEAVSTPRLLPKTECLSVSPDHQWLVCSEEKHRTQFYDLESGQLLELDDAGQAFRQVDLSADGLLLATATDDGTARVWNVATGESILPPLHHGGWCLGVAFSPDQHLLATCAADKAVRIWDLAAAQQPEVLLRAADGFMDAAFAPDGRSIVTLSMGPDFLRIWDAATGRPIGPPLAHNGNLASVRFSPDGKRLAAWPVDDRKLAILGTWQPFGALLWPAINDSPNSMRPILQLHDDAHVNRVEFSPDTKRILTAGEDGSGRVWDAATGRLLLNLKHESEVWWAVFSPDGRHIATTTYERSLRLWDALTGALEGEVKDPNVWFAGIQFSPDGQRLAGTASDVTARVWDSRTLLEICPPLHHHHGSPGRVQFSPDGRYLLTTGVTGGMGLWDIARGDLCVPVMDHRRRIVDAQFSPDGRLLLSCSEDGTARLWDSTTGDLAALPFRHAGGAYGAKFGPFTNRFITAGLDKRAAVWTTTPCNYPVEDIAELAELLRGARLRAGATPQPLRPEELAERFHRSRAKHPEAFATTAAQLANWHERLSEIAQAAHRWPVVVAHIDGALSADPKLPERPTADLLFTRRAQALAELGRFPEACADLERAVQRDRGRFGTRQLLAHMSLVGGLAPQLSAACRAAVQDFAWAANDKSIFSAPWKFGVTWMCTLLPGAVSDFNRPLRFIDSLVEQAPHEFDALAKHGGLLYRAGRFEEASCEIDRAFALHPDRDDWDDSLMLAMARSRAGHASAALRSYERAMESWERNLAQSPAALQWGDLGLFHALESEAEAALEAGTLDRGQTGSSAPPSVQPPGK